MNLLFSPCFIPSTRFCIAQWWFHRLATRRSFFNCFQFSNQILFLRYFSTFPTFPITLQQNFHLVLVYIWIFFFTYSFSISDILLVWWYYYNRKPCVENEVIRRFIFCHFLLYFFGYLQVKHREKLNQFCFRYKLYRRIRFNFYLFFCCLCFLNFLCDFLSFCVCYSTGHLWRRFQIAALNYLQSFTFHRALYFPL